MSHRAIVYRRKAGSPAPPVRQPGPPAARNPEVRQILHRDRRIQRKQVGHVHPASGSDPDHFLYELDRDIFAFSQLDAHYGVSPGTVQSLYPGKDPNKLQAGERIKVPAIAAPAPGSWPVGPPLPAIVQNTSSHDVDVRWSPAPGSNRIGTLKRGTAIGALYEGVVVEEKTLGRKAAGLVEELRHLGLASDQWIFGYMDPANTRVTLPSETSAGDLDLIARMIWGEQRGQGAAAMTAAAWVVKNRFDKGWGSYEQLLSSDQFQGVVGPEAVTGLSGDELARWNEAQTIAREVAAGIRPDPTGGALFFGNGKEMLEMMTKGKCPGMGTISGTNFHYSLGDYTAKGCPIP